MSSRINLCAPTLRETLSSEVAAAVLEQRSHGGMSPYATPNEAAVRRRDDARDRDGAERPAFIRDSEKIIHLPVWRARRRSTRCAPTMISRVVASTCSS